jgi:NDP-sugar pyrophosphorylase family protein
MKAMIFAAGLGSRLKPLTNTMPKALVPINGKPLLEHVILKLKDAGFDEIVINIHHFGEQIIDFLESKANYGLSIQISNETNGLLETGGGIKHAANLLQGDKPFLVHNVDILSDLDISDFYQKALVNRSLVTLLVSSRVSSRYLLFDENNHLKGWINEKTGEFKSPVSNFKPENYRKFAFGGIHVLSPTIFQYMNENWKGKFSIIDFYLSICGQLPIQAHIASDIQLIDVGKPETLKIFE